MRIAGDCHVHMALDGADYRLALDRHRAQPDDEWIRKTLRAYAAAGAMYLRDGGDRFGAARRAAQLAPEYGIEYRTPLFPICKKGRYGAFIGRTFSDFAEYRVLVDEVARDGGDFVKLMISGLMDFNRFGVITSEPLTREELFEMVGYAHDRGIAVMAHANGARVIADAAEAGVDSVEHGAYMDEDSLCALASSGAIWTPTLATIGNLIGDGRYPDGVLRELLSMQMKNVRRFAELGGTVAVGSDAGAYRVAHVQGLCDEIKLLSEALGEAAQAQLLCGQAAVQARFRRSTQ